MLTRHDFYFILVHVTDVIVSLGGGDCYSEHLGFCSGSPSWKRDMLIS